MSNVSRASIVVEFGEGVDITDERVSVEIDPEYHGTTDEYGVVSVPSSFIHLEEVHFALNMNFSRLRVSEIRHSTSRLGGSVTYTGRSERKKETELRFTENNKTQTIEKFSKSFEVLNVYGNPVTGIALYPNSPAQDIIVTADTPSICDIEMTYDVDTYVYRPIDTTEFDSYPILIVIKVDLI